VSDHGTMKDHIEDLMQELGALHIMLNNVSKERDSWRSIAESFYMQRNEWHAGEIREASEAYEKQCE
jgi:hypothetical protein